MYGGYIESSPGFEIQRFIIKEKRSTG